MLRLLVAASIVVTTVSLLSGLQDNKAYACSPGDFDPFVEADVVVAGRYVGYEAVPNPTSIQTFVSPKTGGEETWQVPPSVTEIVELAVDRVYKGAEIGPNAEIVNFAYLERPASGSCGSTASDPTGTYTLTGLRRGDGGTLHYFYSFFSGDGPSGERYQAAVDDVSTVLGAGSLPTADSGAASSTGPISVTFAGAAAAAVAATLIAVSVFRFARRKA